MERHYTIFGKPENTADVKQGYQGGINISRKNASADIGGKVKGAGQDINQGHSRQDKELGRRSQVDNILSRSHVPLIILVVGNQRIGADRNDLVKEVQGEEVIGKGNTDGPEERQGKTGIKAGLGMFMQTAHVAHGIENRNDPQKRSGQGKYHGKGIDPESYAYAWENIENRAFQHFACQYLRYHGGDDQKHDHCRNG
jgi:hypothetical protein